jgi:hypothetical protein
VGTSAMAHCFGYKCHGTLFCSDPQPVKHDSGWTTEYDSGPNHQREHVGDDTVTDLMCALIWAQHYLNMIDGLEPNTDTEFMERVRQMHVDYDQYSAEKDPAVGLFKAHWGEQWAHRFTHEFLFSHYRAPAEGSDKGDEKEQVSP